jgi:hypothetical protein
VPVFVFEIGTDEVKCIVKANTNKIVSGGDDEIMRVEYIFCLRLHSDPDLYVCGHKWELVEIQPKIATKLLV